MSDPIEAAAWALSQSYELEATDEIAATTLVAAWPVLSAGLREMHRPALFVFSWNSGLQAEDPCDQCHGKAGTHPCGCWSTEDTEYECRHCSRINGKGVRVEHPCPTVRELDRIDRELGIEAGNQSGDPCSRQYPEVGHEDDGYTCSTHNMPWGECIQAGDQS